MGSRTGSDNDGASPGKIFIGGLAKDTTLETFTKYFEKYGEITDFVVMKDRHTGRPRGFGFITFADPSVVDTVMQEDHVINGKQVEIKRTIPKGSSQSNDFKTKKIFVGGIPTSVTEDEFKNFFSKYGKVVEHEIIRDHATKRSRGFGFIVFDNEKVVENLLGNGNMIDMEGSQVSTIVQWFPKQSDVSRYVYTLCTNTVRSCMPNSSGDGSKYYLYSIKLNFIMHFSLFSEFNLAEFIGSDTSSQGKLSR
ncbi:hypothetical protein ES332_D07G197300v1 [Gossypium tomentosum]|uniref:RRM domain-containing protein n=1 Tax=Gossypium tomentosum TaxID=34277 RepID=A0A5D2KA96_GOSTO|nr:hypothetical protein ES332_D07G197300v1 [Gossypium tomentosum]